MRGPPPLDKLLLFYEAGHLLLLLAPCLAIRSLLQAYVAPVRVLTQARAPPRRPLQHQPRRPHPAPGRALLRAPQSACRCRLA